MRDDIGIRGYLHWQVHDENGLLLREGFAANLVTNVGDRLYGDRGAGIASPPASPTGMKLGTANTTPAKSGSGAALATYLSDSHQAFDATFPSSALVSGKRVVTYQCTWAPGKATSAGAIVEVVIVNESLTNATSLEAATIARALVVGVGSKPADQGLTIAWAHRLGV